MKDGNRVKVQKNLSFSRSGYRTLHSLQLSSLLRRKLSLQFKRSFRQLLWNAKTLIIGYDVAHPTGAVTVSDQALGHANYDPSVVGVRIVGDNRALSDDLIN